MLRYGDTWFWTRCCPEHGFPRNDSVPHPREGGLFVHQTEYVRGLLGKHQMESANPTKVILPGEECLDPVEERKLAEAKAEDPAWTPNAAELKQAQKGAGELRGSPNEQGWI